MEGAFIRELKGAKVERPVYVCGFPGLGSVGYIAARFLITRGAEKFAELYSPYFPHFAIAEDGELKLVRADFYALHCGDVDFIIVLGEEQAYEMRGQYEIARKIVEHAKKLNARAVVTIGGYRRVRSGKPHVYFVTRSPELASTLREAGAEPLPSGTPIVGLVGVIAGVAAFDEVPAVAILVETPGYRPDVKAAAAALEVVGKAFGVNLGAEDLEKSEKVDELLERTFAKALKEVSIEEERREVRYIT